MQLMGQLLTTPIIVCRALVWRLDSSIARLSVNHVRHCCTTEGTAVKSRPPSLAFHLSYADSDTLSSQPVLLLLLLLAAD